MQWVIQNESGERAGPYARLQLLRMRSLGVISDETLVARAGSEEWVYFSQLELSVAGPSPIAVPTERELIEKPPPAEIPPINPETLGRLECFAAPAACMGRAYTLLSSDFWRISGAAAVAFLILAVPFAALIVGGPVLGGLQMYMLARLRGDDARFSDLFLPFKNGRWGDLQLIFLAQLFGPIALMVPGMILFGIAVASLRFDVGIPLGYVFLGLGILCAETLKSMWFPALMVAQDHRQRAGDALRVSARVIWRNALGVFVARLVFQFVASVLFGGMVVLLAVMAMLSAPVDLAARLLMLGLLAAGLGVAMIGVAGWLAGCYAYLYEDTFGRSWVPEYHQDKRSRRRRRKRFIS